MTDDSQRTWGREPDTEDDAIAKIAREVTGETLHRPDDAEPGEMLGGITYPAGAQPLEPAESLSAVITRAIDWDYLELFTNEGEGYPTQQVLVEAIARQVRELLANAWDDGFKQGGPMHDVYLDDPDAHTRNPHRGGAAASS